jgi:hypothetical protein
MSLIGSVGLTDNQNGLYLGTVNVDNIDDFAITANAFYVNENVNTIQSAVDQVSQADVINISSGSYTESVTITDKLNIGLTAPATASTICEILNGVVIDGTSELVRLSNLQIKGANSKINGVGRHRLNNIVFTGSISQTNNIEIGKSSSKFITINNCEFDNYCSLTVSNLFTSVIYFINCNFVGATITLSQPSSTQVIFNNCAGFVSYPANATYYGMNVLTTGVSNLTTTNVNGSTPSKVSVTSQADHRIVTATGTTDTLHANQTLKWDDSTLQLYPNANPLYIKKPNASSILISDTSTTGSDNNVLIGIGSKCGGTRGVIIGSSSGKATNGNYNLVIGSSSYNSATSASSSQGNICIGSNSMRANITSASQNTSVGVYNNLDELTTGSYNTVLGSDSLTKITTQTNNTVCGAGSMNAVGQTYSNCSVLGANVNVISGNNQVQLGDSATTVYTYATATRSDERDKNEIIDCELGLNFINELKPRQYKFDYREDYRIIKSNGEFETTEEVLNKDGSKTRNRYHNGLIAQEVKKTMDKLNIDFAGYQDSKHNGGDDVLHLNYNEFIAPLIKAVQELSQENKNLKIRIDLLESIS